MTAPSLQLQESLTRNLLWGEAKVKVKDELVDFGLDTDSDPPLWDMDHKVKPLHFLHLLLCNNLIF